MYLVFFLIYFLPTIFAMFRNCNIGLTLLVNLFLGWTCIGWIVAMVLAFKRTDNTQKQPTIIINNTNTSATENAKVNQQIDNTSKPAKANSDTQEKENTLSDFYTQHKKTIGKVLITTIIVFWALFCLGSFMVLIEDSEFNKKISIYQAHSKVFTELYDCSNADIDIREPLCKCLFEYSLKIEDEYLDKKYELSNTQYEYSFQKEKALENLIDKYYQQGVNICSEAI